MSFGMESLSKATETAIENRSAPEVNGADMSFDPDKRLDVNNGLDFDGLNGNIDINQETFDPDKRIDVNNDGKADSIQDAPFQQDNGKIDSSNSVEALQNKCIEQAEQTPLDRLDIQGRGNYGEMKVDRDLAEKGYERVSIGAVTDLSTPTGPGIDGVYFNEKTGVTVILDAKFNKSELGNTLDGKQMSSTWIDNRLDSAVGKEMADKIRMDRIFNPESVQSVLAKVDLNGDVTYYKLDSEANILGRIEL